MAACPDGAAVRHPGRPHQAAAAVAEARGPRATRRAAARRDRRRAQPSRAPARESPGRRTWTTECRRWSSGSTTSLTVITTLERARPGAGRRAQPAPAG